MQLTIRNKLRGLAIIPVLFLSTVLLSLNNYEANSLIDTQLTETRNQLVNLKQNELKHYLDLATSSIADISDDASKKQLGIERLKQLSFNKNGYFFGYNSEGVRLLLGKSDKGIGESFWTLQDKKSQFIVQDLVNTGKQKEGGFYTYYFPRLGETTALPKLSYVTYIEAWDLVIGTGFYIDDIDNYITALRNDAMEARDSTFILTLIVTLVVILVAVATSFLISTGILKRLTSLSDSFLDLTKGNGDLTRRVDEKGNDEVSHLAIRFNAFASRIHQLIADAVKQSQSASNSTKAIFDDTQQALVQLQQKQQYTSSVSSQVEQLVSSSKGIATNANETASAATQAKAYSEEANTTVNSAVSVISELAHDIEDSSTKIAMLREQIEEISNVLAVINGIADQTNLLALNAAIEAARAGEQGRGFAVVADEVRELAQRTQGSTEEIKQTISALQSSANKAVTTMNQSSTRSIEASSVAQKAQTALTHVQSALATITTMNELIASETDNQVTLGSSIQSEVSAIVSTTTETVNHAEKSQVTANELETQMRQLHELMNEFVI